MLLRNLWAKETGRSAVARPVTGATPHGSAGGNPRGERFVDGATGEQFARPETLDLLRAVRRIDQKRGVPSPVLARATAN